MRKYISYKDSGVEWIGQIPSHWTLNKVKHNFSFKTGFTPPSGKSEYYENGTHIWINISDLQGREVNNSANKLTDKAIEDYKPEIVPSGSLLYSFKLSVGRVAFATVECYTNEAIFSIDPNGPANLNFFYYSLPEQVIKNANENIYGAKILNQELIKNAILVTPPPVEQAKIAKYLDQKTSEIDDLIADKKRLLNLYEEEKTVIINEAVIKGINFTAPMKDSGIEWLGEIPKHWEISRMKNICKVRQGLQIPIEKRLSSQVDNSLQYITIRSINNPDQPKEYIENPAENVTCTYDDILMARTGATGEPIINVSGVFHNNFFLVDYDRTRVEKMFLYYFLKSCKIKEYLLLVAGTTTIPDLNHGAFYNTPFFEFDLAEQNLIVRHIEIECDRIQTKIIKTEKLIKLLNEYRSVMISEVITGKINVTE